MNASPDVPPPWSAEAEFSVIGAALVDPEAIHEIRAAVRPEDFFREAHRRILTAMEDMAERGEAIDPVTVAETLKDREWLEAAGGLEYLSRLIDAVPSAAHVEHHARIVRDKARLRRLIDACSETIREARSSNGIDPAEVVEAAERRLFRAAEDGLGGGGYRPPKEAIWAAMELIEAEADSKGGVTGIPTGFPTLDRMTTGLHAGDVTVLAGRPAMGKSSLMWRMIETAADAGSLCAVSSLEMPEAQIVKRALAQRAGVDLMKIRRGDLDQNDYQSLATAAGWLNAAPVRLDDRTAATVPEMRAKARRLKLREGLDLLAIDYLQLMDGEGRNRVEQVTDITREIKRMARELEIHVLAVSQLSRAVESRHPPRPRLSDLRESGSIEQDADNVLMLWRAEEYFTDETSAEMRAKWQGKAELIVEKQRNGPTGPFKLRFDKKTTTFRELAEDAPGWAR